MKLHEIRELGAARAQQRGPEYSALLSAIRALDRAVNAECSCGGRGATDEFACQACMVWHRTMAAEIVVPSPEKPR